MNMLKHISTSLIDELLNNSYEESSYIYENIVCKYLFSRMIQSVQFFMLESVANLHMRLLLQRHET